MSKTIDTHKSCPVKRHVKTPSFSSALLDSIYRSMESESEEDVVEQINKQPPDHGRLPPPKSAGISPNPGPKKADKSVNLKRAIMVEHWMEKQQEEQERQSNRRNRSTGSCSEADLTSCFTPQKPLQFRTPFASSRSVGSTPSTKIASFFNSIFTSSRRRRHKLNPRSPTLTSLIVPQVFCIQKEEGSTDALSTRWINAGINTRIQQTSTCSSTSSFSRSCLSKSSTSPSTNCSSSSGKRSVRFYPLSVIVGEDSRPCGHKCLYDPDPVPSMKSPKLTKLPNLGRSNPWYLRDKAVAVKGFPCGAINNDENNLMTDDAESDDSSDLFELEIGASSEYINQELPLYGTTNFEMNKAIANGFLV